MEMEMEMEMELYGVSGLNQVFTCIRQGRGVDADDLVPVQLHLLDRSGWRGYSKVSYCYI